MAVDKFLDTIRDYAKRLNWNLTELDNDSAVLDFEIESGNDLSVYIDRDEDSIVFSVPSNAMEDEEEDLPDEASTFLLKRNAEIPVGFWALEETEDGWGYVLYHDQKIIAGNLEQNLNLEAFQKLVTALLEECEEFNDEWEEEDW